MPQLFGTEDPFGADRIGSSDGGHDAEAGSHLCV